MTKLAIFHPFWRLDSKYPDFEQLLASFDGLSVQIWVCPNSLPKIQTKINSQKKKKRKLDESFTSPIASENRVLLKHKIDEKNTCQKPFELRTIFQWWVNYRHLGPYILLNVPKVGHSNDIYQVCIKFLHFKFKQGYDKKYFFTYFYG